MTNRRNFCPPYESSQCVFSQVNLEPRRHSVVRHRTRMDVLKTLSTFQADKSFRRFQETLFSANRPRMDVLKIPSTLQADESFRRFRETLFSANRPRMDGLKMPSTLQADKSFRRFQFMELLRAQTTSHGRAEDAKYASGGQKFPPIPRGASTPIGLA